MGLLEGKGKSRDEGLSSHPLELSQGQEGSDSPIVLSFPQINLAPMSTLCLLGEELESQWKEGRRRSKIQREVNLESGKARDKGCEGGGSTGDGRSIGQDYGK